MNIKGMKQIYIFAEEESTFMDEEEYKFFKKTIWKAVQTANTTQK